MKYWRGYLVALIAAACTWGLVTFAKEHTVLVDMIYPYASRMIQTYLAQWSAPLNVCVWQVLLLALITLVLASAVLMFLLKWNPIQWFGWVAAAGCILMLLNTAVYGLNDYAGDLSDDIRMEVTSFSPEELENAAKFFRDRAVALSTQVPRDSSSNVRVDDLSKLTEEVANGFQVLTYEQSMSVFAGSTVPVKELSWPKRFTRRGIAGITVALTGESAINPQAPGVLLPFAICHEMAHRMSISLDRDANFAAFLACNANESELYQYAANLMAYRYCYNALSASGAATQQLSSGENLKLRQDIQAIDDFLGKNRIGESDGEVCKLLVSWHIENYVLPLQVEDEAKFDPQDESQVDLTGIVNANTP